MLQERSNVNFPLWRKKIDSSMFEYNYTPIPAWVRKMWFIEEDYFNATSKEDNKALCNIKFDKQIFNGYVIKGRKKESHNYRLFYDTDLASEIKKTFIMSHMRDIERLLRKAKKKDSHKTTEDDIPFWEFMDIEYDRSNKTFHFTAHYTQKPLFPELFKKLAISPLIEDIYDSLSGGSHGKVYPQHWRARNDMNSEIKAENVIYMLADQEAKELYIGEAKKLVQRLRQEYEVIPRWSQYRFESLPDELAPYRIRIEEMVIRMFSSVLQHTKDTPSLHITDWKLKNRKIKS